MQRTRHLCECGTRLSCACLCQALHLPAAYMYTEGDALKQLRHILEVGTVDVAKQAGMLTWDDCVAASTSARGTM